MLAARADSLWNVFGLRGRQHEDDVVRWFLESLQQGVKGCVCNLVSFIEDVDLETVAGGAVARGFAEFADFVNAAIGGGVNFDDVDGVAGANLGAGFANAAGLRNRGVFRTAIQRSGQNARDGGFADAAMSAENVTVGGASLFDGVLQSAGDV